MTYRVLEHTADLGIEASGATADEVLEQAALALTSILTGREHPHAVARPDRVMRFFVEAPDRGALAVAFLSELLWNFESQRLLWMGGGVRVHTGTEGLLRADAEGNAVVHDAVRHGRGVEVKAVTYHGLAFGPAAKGWQLRVILDI